MPDLTFPSPDFSEPPRVARSRAWLAWVVALVMLGVVGLILYPVFAPARAKAHVTTCRSQMKQLMLGALMYASDYGERLPYAQDWPQRIYAYTKNEQLFWCPNDASPGPLPRFPHHLSYTMNVAANELDQRGSADKRRSELGVIFDGTAMYGWASAATFRHHGWPGEPGEVRGQTCTLGYADGHVTSVRARDFSDKLFLPPWLTPIPLRRAEDLPPLPPGPPPGNP